MRQSQLFTRTRREAPSDEAAKNAQLLIRAGFVHKEMAGVYAYMPLGLRVVENIKNIVREEMNAIGGQEMIMTSLQRKELWEKQIVGTMRKWMCGLSPSLRLVGRLGLAGRTKSQSLK